MTITVARVSDWPTGWRGCPNFTATLGDPSSIRWCVLRAEHEHEWDDHHETADGERWPDSCAAPRPSVPVLTDGSKA